MSGKSWQKHSGVLFVLGETGTEFLGEEGFLAAGFDVEREPSDDHGKQGAHFTEVDGSPEECEQDSRVDRMANGAIGARSNEFVPFLKSDDPAPICAEMPARPKRHRDSRGRQRNTCPFASWTGWKKTAPQPEIKRLGLIKQIKTDRKGKRVSKTLKDRL